MGAKLRKAHRRVAELQGFSPIFYATWACQYLQLLTVGGLTDLVGNERHTAPERMGQALAVYAEAWAALQSERAAIFYRAPLWEKLDTALAEYLDADLPLLTDDEVGGMLAFFITLQVRLSRNAVTEAANDGHDDQSEQMADQLAAGDW